MLWVIGGGVFLVYVVGSYVLMARSLIRSPGPAGLGWLAFPAAPLIGPMILWQGFRGLFRR